jgi:hypothetical protein
VVPPSSSTFSAIINRVVAFKADYAHKNADAEEILSFSQFFRLDGLGI